MTRRHHSRQVVAISWLLTAGVAWAAAFVGGWVGLVVFGGLEPRSRIIAAAVMALIVAIIATGLWSWLIAHVSIHGRRRQAEQD